MIVTENLFGDILSDRQARSLGAWDSAVATSVTPMRCSSLHGSTDIGRGVANPTVLRLRDDARWFGDRYRHSPATDAAQKLDARCWRLRHETCEAV